MKTKNTGLKRRGAALVAAALALAAVAAFTVARLGPGGSIGYSGSPLNPSSSRPSGRHAITVLPAAQRAPADPLEFSTPGGGATSLAAFHGRTVLVNLWATWCPPCVAEMPSLDALQAELGGDRFQVVTVSLDRGGEGVAARWLEHKGLSHLHAFFADPARFPDAMLPHSMLIDPQGRVALDVLGGRAWDSSEAAAAIRQVMAEAAPDQARAGDPPPR